MFWIVECRIIFRCNVELFPKHFTGGKVATVTVCCIICIKNISIVTQSRLYPCGGGEGGGGEGGEILRDKTTFCQCDLCCHNVELQWRGEAAGAEPGVNTLDALLNYIPIDPALSCVSPSPPTRPAWTLQTSPDIDLNSEHCEGSDRTFSGNSDTSQYLNISGRHLKWSQDAIYDFIDIQWKLHINRHCWRSRWVIKSRED